MSLSKDRTSFVTASQAHRVMAGYDREIKGLTMEMPVCEEVILSEIKRMTEILGRKVKVGEMKEVGVVVSGKLIDEVSTYIKAVTPVFSDSMESLAREIAMSKFIDKGVMEGFISVDMERGIEQEGEAVAFLSRKLGIDFSNKGEEQVFLSDGSLGVTPDGVEYDGFSIESCAEVKNPKDTTHMKYLQLLRNQDDLLAVCPNYYWQAQCGLSVTGAKVYHWASYHNEFEYPGHEDESKLVYVPVYPVDDHIKTLESRADRVLERVPVIVDEILNNLNESTIY